MSDNNSNPSIEEQFDDSRAQVAIEAADLALPPADDEDRPHINEQLNEQVMDAMYQARDLLGVESLEDLQVVTGVNEELNDVLYGALAELGLFESAEKAAGDVVTVPIQPQKIRRNQDDNEVIDVYDNDGNKMTVAQVEAQNEARLQAYNTRQAAEYRAGLLAELGLEHLVLIDANSSDADNILGNFKDVGISFTYMNVKNEVDWSTFYDWRNGEGEFAEDAESESEPEAEAEDADAESDEADEESEADAEDAEEDEDADAESDEADEAEAESEDADEEPETDAESEVAPVDERIEDAEQEIPNLEDRV